MAITTYGTLKTAVKSRLAGRTDLDTTEIPEFISMAEDRIAQDLRIRAMQNRADIRIKGNVSVSTVGGTADAITLTPSTAATAYALNDRYSFTVASNNTTAVQVNVSGLGAKDLQDREGEVLTALEADELQAGATAQIIYDGTRFLRCVSGAALVPSRFIEAWDVHLGGDNKKLDFVPVQDFWSRAAAITSGLPTMYTILGDFIVVAPVTDVTRTLQMSYYRRFANLSADSDTNWLLTNARGLLLGASLLEAFLHLRDDARALVWAQYYEDMLERLHAADDRSLYPAGLTARTEVSVQ